MHGKENPVPSVYSVVKIVLMRPVSWDAVRRFVQLSKIDALAGLGRVANSVSLKRWRPNAPSCLKARVFRGSVSLLTDFFQSAVKSCFRHPHFLPSFAVENVKHKGFVALRKQFQRFFKHILRQSNAAVAD